MLKIFNKKPKPQPVYATDLVGAIGKLPVHMEFIKHHVTRAEIARLDQWLQTAFHELSRNLGEQTKPIFKTMPDYHFMMIANQQQPMLGSLIGSNDQSGRIYPFITFRFIENPVAKEFQATIPVLYDDYYHATDHIAKQSWQEKLLSDCFAQINHLNQFDTQINRRMALESAIDSLQTITVKQFWQVIMQDYSELSRGQFFQSTLAEIKQIQYKLTEEKSWGLRFPISRQHPKSSVIFWLQLIDVMLPDKNCLQQVFWQVDKKPAVTVFFKPMPASYLQYLVDVDFCGDGLVDCVEVEINEMNPDLHEIVSQENHSLMQLLTKISHPGLLEKI